MENARLHLIPFGIPELLWRRINRWLLSPFAAGIVSRVGCQCCIDRFHNCHHRPHNHFGYVQIFVLVIEFASRKIRVEHFTQFIGRTDQDVRRTEQQVRLQFRRILNDRKKCIEMVEHVERIATVECLICSYRKKKKTNRKKVQKNFPWKIAAEQNVCETHFGESTYHAIDSVFRWHCMCVSRNTHSHSHPINRNGVAAK